MLKEFLEAGKVTGTHGIRGEVKIQPWANTPAFLAAFKTLYLDGAPVAVISARVHKGSLIVLFGGVETIDDAVRLKNKTVYIKRDDASLPPGEHFIADLIGLDAFDDDTGEKLGRVTDVLTLTPHNVYVITGTREILIPAVPDFVRRVDLDAGIITFHRIEGMS
ncbi:ribosome maturation factor RimM [Oscillospiraceae bacterium WX1]